MGVSIFIKVKLYRRSRLGGPLCLQDCCTARARPRGSSQFLPVQMVISQRRVDFGRGQRQAIARQSPRWSIPISTNPPPGGQQCDGFNSGVPAEDAGPCGRSWYPTQLQVFPRLHSCSEHVGFRALRQGQPAAPRHDGVESPKR